MRVWPPPWSTASCTTARCFISRDLRFDSKAVHWTASWLPRHLHRATALLPESRLSTALLDQRTQCVEHVGKGGWPEHDPARGAVCRRRGRVAAQSPRGHDAV